MRLLTTGNPKTSKGRQYGYHTGILHLHPSKRLCPNSTKGCLAACLNTAGRAGIIKKGETTNHILEARKTRTRYMQAGSGVGFYTDLHKDLELLQRQAAKANLIAAARLNGTSDLEWTTVIREHPGLQFYDYTKSYNRMHDFLSGKAPSNYHLTFSLSESNWQDCLTILLHGGSSAWVTQTGDPKAAADWAFREHGLEALEFFNGDEHDLTFLRPGGSVLVLKAKGKARKDTSGFVLQC